MKRNDIVDLKSKTWDELLRLETDLRSGMSKLKIEAFGGKMKNTNAARNKRKDFARILTFLHMKAVNLQENGKESSTES